MYIVSDSFRRTWKALYQKNRLSRIPAFLPVIAFLKLIQVITKLFNTQKMGKSTITCQKVGDLEFRFNHNRALWETAPDDPGHSDHWKMIWTSCDYKMSGKISKGIRVVRHTCEVTLTYYLKKIFRTTTDDSRTHHIGPLFLLRLESSWQSFHDKTWLILDLDTQYFMRPIYRVLRALHFMHITESVFLGAFSHQPSFSHQPAFGILTFTLIYDIFQERNIVGSWLNHLYGNGYTFWVYAKDIGGDDVNWYEYGDPIDPSFWLGTEPNHGLGDCVFISTYDPFPLEMTACDNDVDTLNGKDLYPLCEFSP